MFTKWDKAIAAGISSMLSILVLLGLVDAGTAAELHPILQAVGATVIPVLVVWRVPNKK